MRTFHSQVKGPTSLGKALAGTSRLSLEVLKDAATKGAVWWQKQGKGKILRQRNLDTPVVANDKIWLYYDSRVLSLPTYKDPISLEDNPRYGIWIKPAGIVPQGTQSGDHTSLLRAIEVVKGKEVFLVHRLDRETEGLMIVAYTSEAAGKLSDLFQRNLVKKTYQAVVAGHLPVGEKKTIEASLDDKEAVTHYEVLSQGKSTSLLNVSIDTGRFHQIRRHLDFIGHPVMGDPKYGKGNKNKKGLQLLARQLSFRDPWSRKECGWKLDTELCPD